MKVSNIIINNAILLILAAMLAGCGEENPRVHGGPLYRSIMVKFAICEPSANGTLQCTRCSLEKTCPDDAWVVMMHERDVTATHP